MKSDFLIRVKKAVPFFLVIISLLFIHGCMFYFKIETVNNFTAQEIVTYDSLNKYLIIHQIDTAWHLNVLDYNDQNIHGDIDVLPNSRMHYKTAKPNGTTRYKSKNRDKVIDQVHLYMQDSLTSQFKSGDHVTIAYSSVEKTEVYEIAHGRSAVSWILPIVLPIGAAVGLAFIVSCPFIYTYDGAAYALAGEIYGGATYLSLERDDYLLLTDFKPVNNKFTLKISNELKEYQHTNLVDLMLISHPKNSKVYLDKYGCIQTSSLKQLPVSAKSLNNFDYTNQLKNDDGIYFHFNEYNSRTSVNHLILTFNNEEDADSGKLIINAKNSQWADYAYEKFNELFGTYYNNWVAQQNQAEKERLIKRSLDQDIPLSVYLETEKGWEFIDFFNVVGSVEARDMVMAIDLSRAKSKNVRIKLVTGFMFWELDYAAMDFTGNLPVRSTLIKPSVAVDEKGNDMLQVLLNDDELRLEQPVIGNETVVQYNVSPGLIQNNEDIEQTICLHSKGYYEKIVNYQGKPDWFRLMSLRHAHSFSEFSLEEYKKFYENAMNLTLK